MTPRFQADADFDQEILACAAASVPSIFRMPGQQELSAYQFPASSTERPISDGF